MSKKLGNLVKKARTEKGLTQAALAEKVSGLTASDVSKIERGEKEPTQEILKKMAKVLGVTQKSLLDAATGAGKTSSTAKQTSSSKKTVSSLTLTATEKKLVQYYRDADSKTKKAAMNLLKGDSNAIELIGALMSNKGSDSGSSGNSATSDLLSSLLSGKLGDSAGSGKDSEGMGALLEMLGKLNK